MTTIDNRVGDTENALSGARVLVVDDEVLHLRSLDRALNNVGCIVTSASSVPAALEAIQNEDVGFHAAVVDYMLLDRKGSEVVKALCAGDRFTASIVLTGAPSREVLDDAYRSGVHTTLTKPVALEVLLPELQACVEKTIKVRLKFDEARHPRPGVADEAVIVNPMAVPPTSSPERAVAFARREDRATALAKRGGLSEREREVLLEVFTGRKNAQIAERLEIAERTVKFHISNINKKLSVGNRGELMALLAGDPLSDSPVSNGAGQPAPAAMASSTPIA